MGLFSKLFSKKEKQVEPPPEIDLEKELSVIERIEKTEEVPLGKKIHSFEYGLLDIRFDRDITHNGRICIFEGEEKLFSFTVFGKEGEYDILKDAFESAITFLEGDRSIKNLPENQVLKGFYHQH
ncbi:MAG: hypothetical protein R3220_12945 [Balneolaceae bacterium]|nr:hypothetical protein [Balneolaceae bacterium]